MSQELGRRVKALRQTRGLRQVDVAARARVSQSYLTKLERPNYRTNPSLAIVRRLATALGVGVIELIEPRAPRRTRP